MIEELEQKLSTAFNVESGNKNLNSNLSTDCKIKRVNGKLNIFITGEKADMFGLFLKDFGFTYNGSGTYFNSNSFNKVWEKSVTGFEELKSDVERLTRLIDKLVYLM